jgi:DsbC/DsbD-like thiol-disulfide interchange protein
VRRGSFLIALVTVAAAWGQSSNVLSIAPVQKVQAKRNETVPVTIKAQLREGYHVNSNKPNDEYLIPIRLTWEAAPLQLEEVVYPKPEEIKSAFSEKPLSVYSGTFDLVSKLKVPANATAGPVLATGKLRYQACNDRMCLPPKTVEVPLTIYVQ